MIDGIFKNTQPIRLMEPACALLHNVLSDVKQRNCSTLKYLGQSKTNQRCHP